MGQTDGVDLRILQRRLNFGPGRETRMQRIQQGGKPLLNPRPVCGQGVQIVIGQVKSRTAAALIGIKRLEAHGAWSRLAT